MSELTTFVDFEAASRATLSFLHQRFGFDLWMMTRVEGSDCLVLQAENHGYNVEEGTVFRWGDSFCSQMVLGHGPRVVPNAQNVPQGHVQFLLHLLRGPPIFLQGIMMLHLLRFLG